MKYALAVYGAPYASESSQTALHFAMALLEKGHQITRVFFYHDGVYTANVLGVPPQDELDPLRPWHTFAETQGIELVVCVAAALKRGLLNDVEAERYGKSGSNLDDKFEIAGLGQFIDAVISSDKVITFGC